MNDNFLSRFFKIFLCRMKRRPNWLRIPRWMIRIFRVVIPSFIPPQDPRLHSLQKLMEADGNLSEVEEQVVGLAIESYGYVIRTMTELRKRTTENRVLYGVCIALAIGGAYTYDGVRDAQKRSLVAANSANESAHQLALFTAQNRLLITRLDEVARRAQLNGAKTDRRQCREIEKVKTQIRAVILSSPKTNDVQQELLRKQALDRFKKQSCRTLPNAKVIKP